MSDYRDARGALPLQPGDLASVEAIRRARDLMWGTSEAARWVETGLPVERATIATRKASLTDEALALLRDALAVLFTNGHKPVDCPVCPLEVRIHAFLARADSEAPRSRPKPGDLCGIHFTYTPGCAVCDSPLTADSEAGG